MSFSKAAAAARRTTKSPSLPAALGLAAALSVATGCAGLGPQGSAARGPSDAVATELVAIKAIEVDRGSDPSELSPWLTHPSPEVREAAALALGRLRAPAAVSLITPLAEDPSARVRRAAYFSLGQIPEPVSEGALTVFIEAERDASLRAEILRSLGRVGGDMALSHLLSGLADEAPEVREAAATAVGVYAFRHKDGPGLDDAQARAVIGALGDGSPEVRRGACYALVRATLPDGVKADAVTALEALFQDPDVHVRATAARAAGGQGEEDDGTRLAPLLADPEWRVRVNAIRAVGQLGGPTAAWVIRPALDDPHPLVREQAISSLAQLKDAQAADWIEPMMKDASVGISTAALGAVAHLRGAKALPMLKAALNDSSPWTRGAAADALGDLDSAAAVDTLIAQAAKELDPRVMLNVADALGRPDALLDKASDALLKLLGQGDAAVIVVISGIMAQHQVVEAQVDLIDAYKRLRVGRDYEAQVAIIQALTELDAPAALARELLEGATQDPEGRVARAAAEALKALYQEEVEVSSAALSTPVSASSLREARAHDEVWIVTASGTIHLKLFPDVAPLTVANFTRLAGSGFYNGLLWHRVVPGFVVQTGSPRGDGWGGPGYEIPDELNPHRYVPGALGMALSGPDTGGSQVFITHGYEPHLDGTYTVFGQVVEGMDVVDQLVRNSPILDVRFTAEAVETPSDRALDAF